MKPVAFLALLLWAGLAAAVHAQPVRVSVLMHVMEDSADDAALRIALETAVASDPDFLVVNGLKAVRERCSDPLFQQRKSMLEQAPVPVFLSMAGSDWIACRDQQNRPTASVWLNLLREQLYGDISWNGAKLLNLRRQSTTPAFRSYAENTRWSVGQVLFATLHLPADNNHYQSAAGRNSEFEDRQVANREWLGRLAAIASQERHQGIVIFCDGNPLPGPLNGSSQRDGFEEIRRQLQTLADRAGVWVAVVQGPAARAPRVPTDMEWQGRLGHVNLPAGVTTLVIDATETPPVLLD